MHRKKSTQLILSLTVSFALLYWISSSLNWSQVVRDLKAVNYLYLIPCTSILILHSFIRAWRWKYLLVSGEKLKFKNLFDGLSVGNLATYILPLRAGEFIRPYVVTKKEDVPFSQTFSSVVIERFFDLAAVLFTFGVVVQFIPNLPSWAFKGALGLSVVACGILLFIILGLFFPKVIHNYTDKFVSFFPKSLSSALLSFIDGLLKGVEPLRSKSNLVMVLLSTIVVWGVNFLLTWSYLFLFPDGDTSLLLGIVTTILIAFAVAAPSAPGFLGVYQTGCVAGFALFSLSTESAMAFSIVTHALQFIVVVLIGLFSLFRTGLKVSELMKSKKVPKGTF